MASRTVLAVAAAAPEGCSVLEQTQNEPGIHGPNEPRATDLLPRKRDGRKDEVDDLYGQEKTLVVAPFCDLCHGSSARLTWSAVAQGLGPTWRLYKASATGSYDEELSDDDINRYDEI